MTDYEKCGGALWLPAKKLHKKCLRCNRTLKTQDAQERGYGEVCWKKHLNDRQSTLF